MDGIAKTQFYKTVLQVLIHVEIKLDERQIENNLEGEDPDLLMYSKTELYEIFDEIKKEVKQRLYL